MKYLFLPLICFSFLFCACSKKDDPAPEKETVPPIPKIRTLTKYYKGAIQSEETFEYDSLGRLSKQTITGSAMYTYDYFPGLIILKTYWPDTGLAETDSLLLNDKGYVVTAEKGRETIEYTPDGFMARQTFNYGEGAFSLTYKTEDGNTTRRTERNGPQLANVTFRYIYSFSSNSVNTIGNENMGISFYGKQDKNLVNRWQAIVEYPYKTYDSYFTYEFDDQNRVTKQSFLNGGEAPYTSFTYYN